MFWSAEMVNKVSTADDSELKPLMFRQPCQQNSNLQPPRTGTNDCLSYCCRSAPSSTSFPEPARATSLVSSLRHQMQDSGGLESGRVPALGSAAASQWGQVKMLSSGKGVLGKASTERGQMHQLRCVATSYWQWELRWAHCLGPLLRLVHRGAPAIVTLCLILSL